MSNDKLSATFHGFSGSNLQYHTLVVRMGTEDKMIRRMSRDGWTYVESIPEKFWRRSRLVFVRNTPTQTKSGPTVGGLLNKLFGRKK